MTARVPLDPGLGDLGLWSLGHRGWVPAGGPLQTGPPPGGTGPGPGIAPAVIETTALTKRYPGAVTALDQLTVRVGPGITGLVGANGAGKSTLIKILLGLLAPTSGQAAVLGLDCARDGERIRALIGYMPEHDCLPPDVTATEFVTHLGRMSGLPPTAAKERAAESLRHVGLYEERYRQIGTYSTGMKQRVKLAQALVGDPRLLLLDEPTIGLDPAGRAAMLDLISRIGAEFGISILVASHLLGEIEQICDHLVAIDGGRLLRADTMTSFTQVSQVLLVEVDEGTALLEAELAAPGPAAAAGRAGAAGPDRLRRDLRRRPRRRGRPGPAAEPAGAAPAPGRGTVPGRRTGPGRSSVSTQSGPPAARTGVIHDIGYRHYEGPRLGRAAHHPGAGLAQPAVRVRHRPRRQGQDHPGHRVRDHVRARGGQRDRAGQEAATASVPYDTYVFQLRVLVMIIFIAAQAPELVSRDLRSHVLPLYFSPAAAPARLPAGQAGRVHPGLPGHDRDPAAAALPGHDHPGARRRRDLGPDQGADPRPAGRADCGRCCWPSIGLALASLSGRRAYATGAIAICFFLTWALAGLLSRR